MRGYDLDCFRLLATEWLLVMENGGVAKTIENIYLSRYGQLAQLEQPKKYLHVEVIAVEGEDFRRLEEDRLSPRLHHFALVLEGTRLACFLATPNPHAQKKPMVHVAVTSSLMETLENATLEPKI